MFQQAQEYFRKELVDFVGSKQNQSGIIWGKERPNCIIVTSGGKHGHKAGYSDNRLGDGSWYYIGQGSSGDQDPRNSANALLINDNRDVLLFTTREPTAKEFKIRGTRSKLYKYEGLFKVGGWGYVVPTQGKRTGDKLIRVHLLPAQNIYSSENLDEESSEQIDAYEINSLVPTTVSGEGTTLALIEFRKRSQIVKRYALVRAKGICENCNADAPFVTTSDKPFLEVHHIFSLADDGPDETQNVAAVCPNCHRKLHFGKETILLNMVLYRKVEQKEKDTQVTKFDNPSIS
jgi:5-methylcytosine-specific restriction protein A